MNPLHLLSNPHRAHIIRKLSTGDKRQRELCVADIDQAATAQHLRHMINGGLVSKYKNGKSGKTTYYKLENVRVLEILTLAEEVFGGVCE